jgi:hypothetical protein
MQTSSNSLQKSEPPLSREQADDVLRYWLAGLRVEEALQIRPAARPPATGPAVPRLDQPTPGQTYFKLPLDEALAALLSQQTQLTRPFDAELSGFFETWLHGRYRYREDESELSHLVCFPIVHLPKGELAGLVRCPVRLRFGSGAGQAFRAPTPSERRQAQYPLAPDEARLTRLPKVDGAWPFFIDTRLLRQPLAVPSESIDAFFEALRALSAVSELQMLALLTTMLETVARGGETEPEGVSELATRLRTAAAAESCGLDGWLQRLTSTVGRLLQQNGSRARVYPVGIVVDGTQAKTTWHLQRELEALLDGERQRFKLASPLGAYLSGQPLPEAQTPQRALFPGPVLSASQRAAAEGFWGSRLTAVQGPPGTGKTRLILHLCAEALVRSAESLLDGKGARAGLLLITSSNNRAVDNVIEPLGAGEGLPLALRAGSRQACEQQLLAQLRRAKAWLERAHSEPEPHRRERLAATKAQFYERQRTVEQLLAPRRAALARASTKARLEAELAECAPANADASLAPVSKKRATALLLALAPLEKRLVALSELCEVAPSTAAVQTLEAHFRRTRKRQWPAFEKALAEAKLTCELPLPPPESSTPTDAARRMEDWEEAAEAGIARLSELREKLERASSATALTSRVKRLSSQLAALGPEPAATEVVGAALDQASQALFAAAVAAREAWASAHAPELVQALSTAIRTVEQERSLRPMFRSETEAVRLLCRLFGIWGSTLLSLGNCFPTDIASSTRLVIDEAGQCHPAHAVSALVRAESALVIGDTHQLAPVVELSADEEARLLRSCRLRTPDSYLRPYRVHADSTVSSQSLADRAVSTRRSLTDHFRCQPEIIALSDALCGYGLTVHTPRFDRSRHAPYLTRPVSLVDLRGEQARWAGSWYNGHELQETLALLESLLHGGVQPDEIAVITPYRGQLEQLRRSFVQRRIPLESSAELAEAGGWAQQPGGVALGTVHRFQGGERSIVLFSSVVTHPSSLAFLNARPNLLNVAISRAQHHFVCLGHAAVLAQGPRSRLLVEGVGRLAPAAYGGGSALEPTRANPPRGASWTHDEPSTHRQAR